MRGGSSAHCGRLERCNAVYYSVTLWIFRTNHNLEKLFSLGHRPAIRFDRRFLRQRLAPVEEVHCETSERKFRLSELEFLSCFVSSLL